MSYEIPLETLTFIAAADLSAKRYYGVKLDANGQVVLAGDGESAVGVLQNTPISGEAARVMTLGVTFGVAAGNIAAGANVAMDANGKFVSAGGADAIIGTALKSAVADDIFSVLLSIKASTGTTGIAEGFTYIQIPVTLSEMDNVEILTEFVPGFVGTIEGIQFLTTTPTTDAADSTFTVTPDIGGTPTTGGVLTLDVGVAGTDPDTRGKVIDGAAVTGLNSFTAVQDISLTINNTANAFADGAGIIILKLAVNE
jgi:hypothetical protein